MAEDVVPDDSDDANDDVAGGAEFEDTGLEQVDGVTLDFVPELGRIRRIAGAAFTMGCVVERDDVDGDCEDAELPSHEVPFVADFWIMEHELTQRQYLSVVGENPSFFAPGGGGVACGSRCPVERVTWYDAARFANLVSEQHGLEPCYDCHPAVDGWVCTVLREPDSCDAFRLPTEVEWEFAARGGEAWRFSGSDDPDAVAWFADNSAGTTHPVCTKARNAFGLCDMSGNVREWMHNLFYTYGEPGEREPSAWEGQMRAAIRGGSWSNRARGVRVAVRESEPYEHPWRNFGFRLVRRVQP